MTPGLPSCGPIPSPSQDDTDISNRPRDQASDAVPDAHRQAADISLRGRVAAPGGLGPVAGHETAVPTHHGLRLDDQQHLAEPGPVEQLRQQRQDRAVCLVEPRSRHLALRQGETTFEPLGVGPIGVAERERPW